MKIRTITLGISAIPTPQIMKWAGEQLERIEAHLLSQGYLIQTRRLALRHWDSEMGVMPEARKVDLLEMIDSLSLQERITFCSIGLTALPEQIEDMAPLLIRFPRLSACANGFRPDESLSRESINAAAKTVVYLAKNSADSFGNFRFGIAFCMSAGNPFFPGAYHEDAEPSFAIGLENGDLLLEAFSSVQDLEAARGSLFTTLSLRYRVLQQAALDVAAKLRLCFGGIDTSIAPSANPQESIVRAFDSLGVEFGEHGTLATCGMITDVLKSIPVKRVGYCGIMLPILEDAGLAKAVEEGRVSITKLLAYSSICGVGVDMVPIPGDVSANQLQQLMLDVGTMALKLRKPLLVRVLPVLNKRAGDRTEFDSPYICNSKVMAL